MKINLATVLGLRPLDRLQINDRREIEEIRSWSKMGHNPIDLPFFYFQRTMPDGTLEARGTGGYAVFVSVQDVCDIIPGETITVMALPERKFLDRLKSSRGGDHSPPDLGDYAEAHVLYALKDRWGNPDFYVWFVDPANNTTGKPWRAILTPAERHRILGKARRTTMPVSGQDRGAYYSADSGCQRESDYNRDVARRFIAASLIGK